MKKNPRHRPQDTIRIESMLRWYETALVDSRVVEQIKINDSDEKGEEEEGAKNLHPYAKILPKPHITYDRQMSLMLLCAKTSCIDDIEDLTEDEREILFFLDEYVDDLKHINKMLAYKVAAELFNNQLKISQSHGDRLNEKPATAGAIQRAVSRYHKSRPPND